MAKTPRIDPPASRFADGSVADQLRNADPKRHYVLANPNDPFCGLDHYVGHLGYEIETVRPGGPLFPGVNASKDGSQVIRYGQVLVSCPMEDHLRRYNEGQRLVDQRAEAIRKHGDTDGAQRGPTGRAAYWAEDPSEHVVQR
jgi:hypothetical protein